MAIDGIAVATGAFASLSGVALSMGGDLEQAVGGVNKIFESSAATVISNAEIAYKTAGISAVEYMEQVTSFSASLLQSVGGDTEEAARIADMAIIDMADNANTFGTSIESIQNAYQGFAKQNYTMLDNLKLGYGGTKTEMERLLADAEKITGIKYDINNLNDVYEAIHVIQGELNITGTTAKEAAETLSGSWTSAKAAFANFLSGAGDVQPVIDTFSNLAGVVVDRLGVLLPRLATGLGELFKNLAPKIPPLMKDLLPALIEGGITLISGLMSAMPAIIATVGEIIPMIIGGIKQRISEFFPVGGEIMESIGGGLFENLGMLISKIAETATELGPIIMETFGDVLLASLDAISAAIAFLAENFDIVSVAVIAGTVAFGAYQAVIAISGIISTVTTALEGMTLAQYALNLAMNLNPIALVVAAIAALVAGIVYLWNTNEDFRIALINAWEAIKATAENVWNGISGFLIPLWDNLKAVFTTIWNAVSEVFNFAVTKIKQIAETVFGGLKAFWDKNGAEITAIFTKIWTGVSSFLSTTFNAIKSIAESVWNSISSVVKAVLSALKSSIESSWNAIKRVTEGVLNAIKIVIDGAFKAIQGVWNTFAGAFTGDWSRMWSGIKETFTGIFETIKGIFSQAMSVGGDLISGIWSGISDKVGWLRNEIAGFFGGVVDDIKSFFGIASPAKKHMPGIGQNIIEGVVNGIDSMEPEMESAFIHALVPGAAVQEMARQETLGIIDQFSEMPRKIMETISPAKDVFSEWGNYIHDIVMTKSGALVVDSMKIFSQIPGRTWDSIVGTIDRVKAWGDGVISAGKDKVTAFVSTVENISKSTPDKLWGAIKGGLDKVSEWGKSLSERARDGILTMQSTILDAAKDLPDKMESIGKQIGESLAGGIHSMSPKVSDTLNNILNPKGETLDSRYFSSASGNLVSPASAGSLASAPLTTSQVNNTYLNIQSVPLSPYELIMEAKAAEDRARWL